MVKEECASVTTGNESDMFKHLLKELNMVDSGMEIALLPSGAAAVHTYKPSLLAACHSTVLQNGKLHRFWLCCQESCFFARDTRILPVDVESKTSHPRLFVFSLPNMADGIHEDGTWKNVLTGGGLRCLTFPITRMVSTGASPKQVCHPW